MEVLSAEQVKEFVEGKMDGVILNVLPEKSHREGHIPNSYNVPLEREDFTEKVGEVACDKTKPVILYGANTRSPKSEDAAALLEAAGYLHVKDFAGGIKEWCEHSYHLERPQL